MKRIGLSLLFIAACLFGTTSYAQIADFASAKRVAENFRTQINPNADNTVSETFTQTKEGDAVYYIFNYKDGGFVIVSAEQTTRPILGYSMENHFDIRQNNPALKAWMSGYETAIFEARKAHVQADVEAAREWKNLQEGKPAFVRKGQNHVDPLLTCTWNQDRYYNANCPLEGEDISGTAAYDFHTPVGCVALSMSQILYYHRYPVQGTGYSSYTSPYGKLTANYGTTTYDYNAMADVAIGYSDAIARLINHAGISVEMNYGADGSGSQSKNIVNSLKKYFGYGSTIQYAERKNYTDSAWHALLISNLDQGLPMVYGGSPAGGGTGHAFNCDGYDETGKFHMNWGWAGDANGYYDVDNMTKITTFDFSGGHQVVCNIKPMNISSKDHDTLTATYGSFTDGSGYLDYTDNQQRSWLIQPANATSITLSASLFDLAEGDFVNIYSDPEASQPLAVLTGSAKDTSVLVNGPMAYVTFVSNNDNLNGKGFLFNYTTTLNELNYCNTSQLVNNTYKITEVSSTVNNGSNGNDYADANTCWWRIEPKDANAIWIAFDQFDLGAGDELTFYSYNTYNPQVMNGTTYHAASYTKDDAPTIGKVIEFSNKCLYVKFRTDNKQAGKGWTFRYGTNVGVEAVQAGIAQCSVYPNPAKDQINVSLSFDNLEEHAFGIRLMDAVGRTLYQMEESTNGEEYQQTIPTEQFAAGVYFLNIRTDKGTVSKKIQIVK